VEGLSLAGPGLLFVVSGPSGAGKDTLVAALRDRMPRVRYSVSATTRSARPGEADGVDYHFLSRAQFDQWMSEGKFLETREYNGNFYGTPLPFLEKTLRQGYDVVMKPEVNGALAIKAAYPDATLIFLLPNTFSQLQKRLEARRTETTEEIAERMAIAHEELKELRSFDYLVINEHGREADAVEDLVSIVRAERYRIHRYSDSVIRMIEQT
jgi:guanylate kinase